MCVVLLTHRLGPQLGVTVADPVLHMGKTSVHFESMLGVVFTHTHTLLLNSKASVSRALNVHLYPILTQPCMYFFTDGTFLRALLANAKGISNPASRMSWLAPVCVGAEAGWLPGTEPTRKQQAGQTSKQVGASWCLDFKTHSC